MGKALAEAHPGMAIFEPVQGAGHNDVLLYAQEKITRAMAGITDLTNTKSVE